MKKLTIKLYKYLAKQVTFILKNTLIKVFNYLLLLVDIIEKLTINTNKSKKIKKK